MKFILCPYQQETRHFTWKSSQRSSIGRSDAILNDKIRNEKKKKTATVREQRSLAKIGNSSRQTPAETELRKWNGNFCSNRLERKKGNSSEGHPLVPENFQSNCAYHLHLNRSKWKAPQVSVLDRCTIWKSWLYCKLENAFNKGLILNFTTTTDKQQR